MNMTRSCGPIHEEDPVALPRKGYGDVLALVTSSKPWSPAAFAGVDIAAMFNAHVTGCYVDASLRSLQGIDDEPTVMALLMDSQHAHRKDGGTFSAFARTRGVRHATWLHTQVGLTKTMRWLGAWHDLIVLERDLAEESLLIDLLGEAVLTCRTPCLVLPSHWDKPLGMRHIVIGWNGSIEAVRAIHASLSLAEAAEHVTILRSTALPPESDASKPPAFDPAAYLRGHGVNVTNVPLRTNSLAAGEAILKETARLGADCLVMGAYGHARVRERVLGGATRHVLQHAGIPVLMQH